MTVYSINKRVFDQAQAGAQAKSSSNVADEFLAALNKAGGNYALTAAQSAPQTEKALKKAFDKPEHDAPREPKTVDKPKRAEKTEERSDRKDVGRSDKADEPKAETAEVKTEQGDAAAQNAGDEQKSDADAPAAETATVEDQAPQQDAQSQTAETQVIAVAVQPQVETVAAAETQAGADGQTETVVVQQTDDGAAQNAAAQNAGNEQTEGDIEAFDPLSAQQTAAQNAAKAKSAAGEGKADMAAKAQADDMAAMLDDTGAQLNVQVKVSDKVRVAEPSVGTAEVLLTQDVDGLDPALQFAGDQNAGNRAGSGNSGAAQSAQQVANNPALNNAADPAMQARPFAAALAAAQADPAVQQTQTNAGSANSQQPQNVAGLNGTGGPQGAAKTAQPQAAHAPRPQQMPQQQEVIDQVKVQIAKQAAGGGDTIKVQLKPVELGSIEVKLEVAKDGSVTGHVIADNKDTLTMLKNDSRSLEKALADAGLKADAGSLEFSLRGDQQQAAQNQQGQTRKSRRQKLAEATGIDLTAATAAQAQARMGGGRAGVDIKV